MITSGSSEYRPATELPANSRTRAVKSESTAAEPMPIMLYWRASFNLPDPLSKPTRIVRLIHILSGIMYRVEAKLIAA
ncbi:hypothetical protein D3C74_353860 [compost metagenome]